MEIRLSQVGSSRLSKVCETVFFVTAKSNGERFAFLNLLYDPLLHYWRCEILGRSGRWCVIRIQCSCYGTQKEKAVFNRRIVSAWFRSGRKRQVSSVVAVKGKERRKISSRWE